MSMLGDVLKDKLICLSHIKILFTAIELIKLTKSINDLIEHNHTTLR